MLQRDLAAVLEECNQVYEVPCPLPEAASKEVTWWKEQLTGWNGKSLVLRSPAIQMESDASQIGWEYHAMAYRLGGPGQGRKRVTT